MTEQTQNDPQKTLEEARQRLDALHREASTIHDRRREVVETETAQRMEQAIQGGDVAGAASAALLDLEDLDRREDELPALIWGAQLATLYAEAAVERQRKEAYLAREPEARKRLRETREAAEQAEAEFSDASAQYGAIETGAERAEERELRASGEAQDLFERGPNPGPLGGQVSPMEGGGTTLRNLRRPRR